MGCRTSRAPWKAGARCPERGPRRRGRGRGCRGYYPPWLRRATRAVSTRTVQLRPAPSSPRKAPSTVGRGYEHVLPPGAAPSGGIIEYKLGTHQPCEIAAPRAEFVRLTSEALGMCRQLARSTRSSAGASCHCTRRQCCVRIGQARPHTKCHGWGAPLSFARAEGHHHRSQPGPISRGGTDLGRYRGFCAGTRENDAVPRAVPCLGQGVRRRCRRQRLVQHRSDLGRLPATCQMVSPPRVKWSSSTRAAG